MFYGNLNRRWIVVAIVKKWRLKTLKGKWLLLLLIAHLQVNFIGEKNMFTTVFTQTTKTTHKQQHVVFTMWCKHIAESLGENAK